MAEPSRNVEAALATLRERWGGAAPRWGEEVVGALAVAPRPEPAETPEIVEALRPVPADARGIPTGFRALDAILGLGGLPRTAATALAGDGTSGKTTLALQAVAQAQLAGGIAAYLDLGQSLDPVEAAARGVQLDWLVVLAPDTLDDALAMAAMLLQDRAVDLVLLDLPARLGSGGSRTGGLGDRLRRLAALARRAEVQLIVVEPPDLPSPIRGAVAEAAALRLELRRQSWIRLGRDIVGQRTEVRVARSRFGPPGRTADLRILYAEGGSRDACLRRPELLETMTAPRAVLRADRSWHREGAPPGVPGPDLPPPARPALLNVADSRARRLPPPPRMPRPTPIPVSADATPSSPLAPSPPSPGGSAVLRTLSGSSDRSRRPAVDGRHRARRESGGSRTGSPARDAVGSGAPSRA